MVRLQARVDREEATVARVLRWLLLWARVDREEAPAARVLPWLFLRARVDREEAPAAGPRRVFPEFRLVPS